MTMNNADLIREYATYLERVRNYTHTSVAHNKSVCRRFGALVAQRGTASLLQARAQDVLEWIDQRTTAGIASKTVSRELCILRTFYEFTVAFCGSSSAPTHSLPPFICSPRNESGYLTDHQVFDMLECIDISTPQGRRNYVIIALLWCTGLRSRELCSLQWRDIDLEEGVLLVRKGKGNKQRQVPLNDRLWEDLRRYRSKLLAGPTTPVFCAYHMIKSKRRTDASLSVPYLAQIVREAARAAHIEEKVTPLTLRHTFATHLYEAGVPLSDIKEMMGHDRSTETSIYVHVTLQAARNLLSNHLTQTFIPSEHR